MKNIKTVFYSDTKILNRFQELAGSYNQKTKTGGMAEKLRQLMEVYVENTAEIENLIKKL
jgi:isopentenyl phosphate kinase